MNTFFLLIRFLIVLLIVPIRLLSQEDNHAVQIESISDLNHPQVSMAYRFMVADFLQSGGKGRTFLVKTDNKDVAGYYLAVDKLPTSINLKGNSLITRDPKVLAKLQKAQKEGIPLFLESIDHKIDAQVFGDEILGKSLLLAAFPKSKTNFSLSISPSTREDILTHEMAHIKHKSPSHPISLFLEQQKTLIKDPSFSRIRRALTELGAYNEQHAYLENLKKQGRKNILILVADSTKSHHVEIADFKDIYKKQMDEILASSGMYMSMIPTALRKIPSESQCALIDQIRNTLSGMGSIESELLQDYPLERCTDSSSSDKKSSTTAK